MSQGQNGNEAHTERDLLLQENNKDHDGSKRSGKTSAQNLFNEVNFDWFNKNFVDPKDNKLKVRHDNDHITNYRINAYKSIFGNPPEGSDEIKELKKLKKDTDQALSRLGKELRDYYQNPNTDIKAINEIKDIHENISKIHKIRHYFLLNNDSSENGYGINDFDGLNGYDEYTDTYYYSYQDGNKNGFFEISGDDMKKIKQDVQKNICGLNNIGSVCYMNSTLQASMADPYIVAYCIKYYEKYGEQIREKVNKYNHETTQENLDNIKMIDALAEVVYNVYKSGISAYSPDTFNNVLINNEKTVFVKFAAGDAKDVVRCVYENIHKQTCIKNCVTNDEYASSIDSKDRRLVYDNFMRGNDYRISSIISKRFYRHTTLTAECLHLGCCNVKYNSQSAYFVIMPTWETSNMVCTSNNLKLQGSNFNFSSLHDAIEYLNRNEVCDGNNKAYCGKCQELRATRMTDNYLHISNNFIIVFNKGKDAKNQQDIIPPLFFRGIDGRFYILRSATQHAGKSGASGHFVAYNPKEDGENIVMRLYNDFQVNDIKLEEEKNSSYLKREPYLVYYHAVSDEEMNQFLSKFENYDAIKKFCGNYLTVFEDLSLKFEQRLQPFLESTSKLSKDEINNLLTEVLGSKHSEPPKVQDNKQEQKVIPQPVIKLQNSNVDNQLLQNNQLDNQSNSQLIQPPVIKSQNQNLNTNPLMQHNLNGDKTNLNDKPTEQDINKQKVQDNKQAQKVKQPNPVKPQEIKSQNHNVNKNQLIPPNPVQQKEIKLQNSNGNEIKMLTNLNDNLPTGQDIKKIINPKPPKEQDKKQQVINSNNQNLNTNQLIQPPVINNVKYKNQLPYNFKFKEGNTTTEPNKKPKPITTTGPKPNTKKVPGPNKNIYKPTPTYKPVPKYFTPTKATKVDNNNNKKINNKFINSNILTNIKSNNVPISSIQAQTEEPKTTTEITTKNTQPTFSDLKIYQQIILILICIFTLGVFYDYFVDYFAKKNNKNNDQEESNNKKQPQLNTSNNNAPEENKESALNTSLNSLNSTNASISIN